MRKIWVSVINPQWPVERIRSAIELFAPKSVIVDDDCDYAGHVTLSELKSTARGASYGLPEGIELPAAAIFTSGSSGVPKIAVLGIRNLFRSAEYSNKALNFGGSWLLSLPAHHVGGLSVIFRCLIGGGTLEIPQPGEALSDAITRLEPTHVSLVATQLYRLLRDDAACVALARCKAVVMGGGPTPDSLVREAVERGIPLVMSYGMTETAAMICCTRPGDPVERLLSSGKPLVDGTVSISSDGEILVRGDQLFMGYLQPDGSLHRPLTDDGWFRTGDLGHFDEAGYLHVTGRIDNMFISGGENIQPEEIEEALRNVNGVEEAIVVPVDSAEWGRRPVAFVRMAEGQALDPQLLESALRKVLPGYKVPRTYFPWPDDLAQSGLKPARRDFEARAAR
jgi:O-succinylbenzoic acid--CoA ligase